MKTISYLYRDETEYHYSKHKIMHMLKVGGIHDYTVYHKEYKISGGAYDEYRAKWIINFLDCNLYYPFNCIHSDVVAGNANRKDAYRITEGITSHVLTDSELIDYILEIEEEQTSLYIKHAKDVYSTFIDGLLSSIDYSKNESSVLPKIEKVIFNEPATIIKWNDGTKTIVKSQDGDEYDHEKGLAIAICKKVLGNKGNYNNIFKKWLPNEKE